MAIQFNPRIVTDRLAFCLDAANLKSYTGTGVTWADLSATNSPSNLLNGVAFSNNNLGSFDLDGTDDTIKFPFDLTYVPALSNFSLEIWVKITSFPTALASPNGSGYKRKNGVLMGAAYYSGVGFYWTGDESGTSLGVYGFIRGNDAYRTTGTYNFSLNNWTHLVLVNNYSSTLFQYYVNGAFHSQTDGPTQEYNAGLAASAENVGIAKAQVDGGGIYNYTNLACNCSFASVYKKALSAQEIAQNYNALRGRFGI